MLERRLGVMPRFGGLFFVAFFCPRGGPERVYWTLGCLLFSLKEYSMRRCFGEFWNRTPPRTPAQPHQSHSKRSLPHGFAFPKNPDACPEHTQQHIGVCRWWCVRRTPRPRGIGLPPWGTLGATGRPPQGNWGTPKPVRPTKTPHTPSCPKTSLPLPIFL